MIIIIKRKLKQPISDKEHFKDHHQKQKGHFIMIKGSINQKDITILLILITEFQYKGNNKTVRNRQIYNYHWRVQSPFLNN